MTKFSEFKASDYLTTKESIEEYVNMTSLRIAKMEAILMEMIALSETIATEPFALAVRYDEAIEAAREVLEDK